MDIFEITVVQSSPVECFAGACLASQGLHQD